MPRVRPFEENAGIDVGRWIVGRVAVKKRARRLRRPPGRPLVCFTGYAEGPISTSGAGAWGRGGPIRPQGMCDLRSMNVTAGEKYRRTLLISIIEGPQLK